MAEFDYLREPEAIYRRSFEIIESESALDNVPEAFRPLAIRIIHACGMVDIVDDMRFSADALQAGRSALAAGAPIFCDVRSVQAAIIGRLLPKATRLLCNIDAEDVARHARAHKMTRAAAQIDLWGASLNGAIVVIGNAPTMLFRLLEAIDDGIARPALIVGFPVGFVGAAESKEALHTDSRGVAYITIAGRRGGSAMAGAAVNALAAGLAR